jgi:glycosyltransferase involved in cell wall biosynthesis
MLVFYDHEIFSGYNRCGVSRYFRELSKRLEGYGTPVTAFGGWHISDANSEMPRFIGVRTRAIRLTSRVRFGVNRILERGVLARLGPDVIHKTMYCHGWYPANVPVVITIHDMAHERGYIGDSGGHAEKKAYWAKRATHIITPSHTTRNDLLDILHVPPDKVSVIHHGADHLPIMPAHEASVERPYFLYVGGRHAYKDFPVLVSALVGTRAARDYSLICCGGTEFTGEEVRLMAAAGLLEIVQRCEPDDRLLSHLYSGATCLVYPSRCEGYGLPIAEAMRLQCPVIAADTPISREVTGSRALLFEPGNAESLRHAIETIAYDNDMRSVLGRSGSDFARERTWDLAARNTAQVYGLSVAARRHARHDMKGTRLPT